MAQEMNLALGANFNLWKTNLVQFMRKMTKESKFCSF